MELHITSRLRVKDLQSQFATLFPFLKIELYPHPHQKGEGSGRQAPVHDKLFLREVTGKVVDGPFIFEPELPVATFEGALQNWFGLPVQVFRKSGELWLETVQTDQMSLKAQNELGRESTAPTKTRFNVNTLFL